MFLSLVITRKLARLLPLRMPRYRVADVPSGRPRVLVTGIYVANKSNTVEHLVSVFAGSQACAVEQRWACMKGQSPSPAVAAVTVRQSDEYVPKWMMLAELMGERPWEEFDYVICADDDIYVGDGFIDRLIALQQRYDFALAQPARTWRSFTDWPIVRRRLFTRARQTRFVEGGPLVSMDRRFLPLAIPFSPESPMGWGYDLIWPVVAERNGLKLGIIDAVPVDHSIRARGALYADKAETERMAKFLSTREHLRLGEVDPVVATYR